MISEYRHAPVLLSETISGLRPAPNGCFIDATLGGAGHGERLLTLTSPDGALLGIDADQDALEAARERLAPFGPRAVLAHAHFDRLQTIARGANFDNVDGILFDLGFSSPQIDWPHRGFSFQTDGPLDMRFDTTDPETAADIVNLKTEDDLLVIFRDFGEERFGRKIARRIVWERQRAPIRTTARLATIVAQAKSGSRRGSIHPATRVFQALRIAVNDELGQLRRALPQTLQLLKSGGRLAVISFHSLEDRIVKEFIRRESRDCICPPNVPVCGCNHSATLRELTRKPVTPSLEETHGNPRSRSARLRIAEKQMAKNAAVSSW